MELKRKYREAPSISTFKLKLIKLLKGLKLRDRPEPEVEYELKENGWWRRNLFSLTGLYYHLSRYGEDLDYSCRYSNCISFNNILDYAKQANT